MRARGSLVLLGSALVISFPLPARALDRFEIQVYEDDVDAPLHPGLEIHTNYTIAGRTSGDYPEQIPANHVARMTFEPSFGLTEFLELGGYFQTFVAPDHGLQYGGFKLRTKWVVPPRLKWPIMLGINAEIGRVPKKVEEYGWANEFRPIIGTRAGIVTAVVNPIFGYALSGPDRLKPDFEPAAKLAFDTEQGFSLGAEYYAGLGQFQSGFDPVHEQEHLLFAVFDLVPRDDDPSPWELNAGFGRSLTDATAQHWILKTIVGKSF